MKGIVPLALLVMAALAAETKHQFSPRMDYEEWKPLGRGDPLNNDPTYDYVPPVLDRVRYWIDPSKRTPDPPQSKTDVMVLGAHTEIPITATTLKATSRLGTIPFLDPILRFMDASNNGFSLSSPAGFFRPTPSPQHYTPQQHYSQPSPTPTDLGPPPPPPTFKVQALQRPPYTMLMPPPPPTLLTEVPETSFGTSTKTTTPADETSYTTVSTQKLDATSSSAINITIPPVTTTVIAKIENLYKPVAINMPESVSNETNEFPFENPTLPEEMQPPLVSLFDDSNHIQYQDKPTVDTKKRTPQEKQPYSGFLPTTIRTPLTTDTTSLTTDPIFKHYNQPSKPVRPPYYLIIQGHSKVKTYGAGKQKIKPLTSNEIYFGDEKSQPDGIEYEKSRRKERKLRLDPNDLITEGEVIQGRPTIELSAKYQTKDQLSFMVEDKRKTRKRRSITGRNLLAVAGTKDEVKLDDQQLGLESLIALNDDYNSEDVIKLLLKEEGQGSGFSGLINSILGRSLRSNDEI